VPASTQGFLIVKESQSQMRAEGARKVLALALTVVMTGWTAGGSGRPVDASP